jgi:hypothetical protein
MIIPICNNNLIELHLGSAKTTGACGPQTKDGTDTRQLSAVWRAPKQVALLGGARSAPPGD